MQKQLKPTTAFVLLSITELREVKNKYKSLCPHAYKSVVPTVKFMSHAYISKIIPVL
jgi:hypothetical protein